MSRPLPGRYWMPDWERIRPHLTDTPQTAGELAQLTGIGTMRVGWALAAATDNHLVRISYRRRGGTALQPLFQRKA